MTTSLLHWRNFHPSLLQRRMTHFCRINKRRSFSSDCVFSDLKQKLILQTQYPSSDVHKNFAQQQLLGKFTSFLKFKELNQLTTNHFNSFMNSLISAGEYKRAISIYGEMKKENIFPNMKTLKLLIKAVSAPIKRERLHQYVEEANPVPSLEGSLDLDDLDNLEDFLDEHPVAPNSQRLVGDNGLDFWPEWPRIHYVQATDPDEVTQFP